ncbi:MAG: oligosaccharide flippase family protein [Eubacteriales bacterium]|nr:oligosaccharide flippase family protein [Eubacteriales bacterium]
MGYQDKKSNFLMQGTILAFAGLIVRLIGVFYRIPMINIIGEEGNGYYTSAYNIYSLFLILSSYSFPVALSKILSYKFSKRAYANAYSTFKISLIIATIIGLIMFLIMYFGSDFIANLVGKPFLKFSLRVFAPTLWVMAYLSVFRGLFQGTGTMMPTAISQIFEQIVNAIISIVFCYILFNRGLLANVIYESNQYSYAFGSKGATIGTFAGASIALVILLIMYLSLAPRLKYYASKSTKTESNKEILQSIFFTVTPIIMSSTIYNIFSVVSDICYSNIILRIGNSATMNQNWGIYGEFHLLFNIPVAIASALTSSAIPAITAAIAKRDGMEASNRIKYSIRFTLLILLPAFVGLSALASPISKCLFNAFDDNLLVNLIRVGSASIVLYGITTITSGILQSISLMKKPIIHGAISLVVSTISLIVMLIVFKLDIYSVVIANTIFPLIISILNIITIIKVVHYRMNIFSALILPTCISFIMGSITFFVYNFIESTLPSFFSQNTIGLIFTLLFCIILAFFIYLVLIIILGVVRKEDANYLPLFSKIKKVLRQ